MRDKDVLVIDGTTEIGSIICNLLIKNGYKVYCLGDFEKNLDGLKNVITDSNFLFLNTKERFDETIKDLKRNGFGFKHIVYAVNVKKRNAKQR